MIPKSADANHESFNVMARAVVQSTMERVISINEYDQAKKIEVFYEILTKSTNEDLTGFLQGTPAYSMLGNDKLVGTIRSIITTQLTAHKHCKIGNFSLEIF